MRPSFLLLAAAMLAGGCRSTPATRPSAAVITPTTVRHVVVFKFKPGATPEQVDTLTRAVGALRDSIPGIVGYEHGVNNSPEGLNMGFTHVYVFTFTSAAARDAYLVHPAHKRFGELVGRLGIWDGGFVVDYVPQP